MPIVLFGVTFNEQKLVQKCLTNFYNLGPTMASKIMAKYSMHSRMRIGEVSNKVITALNGELTGLTLDTDARRLVQERIARLKSINSYRGRRHAMNLPVRGQRARNQTENARKFNRIDRRI